MVAALDGKRVLIVGGSAGIGQAVAVRACELGADVAVSARRADKLAETCERAGRGHPVVGDVRAPGGAADIVAQAVAQLGGLDLVFYAAGYAPLSRLLDTDSEAWRAVFETNVLGVHETLRAAVPRMSPAGIACVLSSETVGRPRTGLGCYGSSKAATEEALRAWQLEHPEVRFSCVAIGATQPTEFGLNFDMELLGPTLEEWAVHGLMQERFMETSEVGAFLTDTLASALANPSLNVEHLVLRSPSAVVGSATMAKDNAAAVAADAQG